MCVVRHLAAFTLQPGLDRQYRYPHYSWHDRLSSGEHLHWLQVTTDTSSHTATSRGCLCTTDALNMSFWNSWIKLLFWSTQKHSNILPTYIWPDVWEVESCDELMVEQKVKTNDIFSPSPVTGLTSGESWEVFPDTDDLRVGGLNFDIDSVINTQYLREVHTRTSLLLCNRK